MTLAGNGSDVDGQTARVGDHVWLRTGRSLLLRSRLGASSCPCTSCSTSLIPSSSNTTIFSENPYVAFRAWTASSSISKARSSVSLRGSRYASHRSYRS